MNLFAVWALNRMTDLRGKLGRSTDELFALARSFAPDSSHGGHANSDAVGDLLEDHGVRTVSYLWRFDSLVDKYGAMMRMSSFARCILSPFIA